MDISGFLRPIFFPFAKQFIAGERLEDALRVVKKLNREGKSATINLLGEHIYSNEIEKTRSVVSEYLRALREIHRRKLNSTISLKLTQIGLDINDTLCFKNLDTIMYEASKLRIGVEIDMESSEYTTRTIEIYLKLFDRYKGLIEECRNIRIALQAKLFRTQSDLVRIASAGGKVRLCKGAYKELPSISETRSLVIGVNFLSLIAKAFEDTNFPAVATGDEDIMYLCRTRLSKRLFDSRKKEFEFQMLYGVAPELQRKLVKAGYNLRIYIPYGQNWLPYFQRRLGPEFLMRLIKMKLQK